jgi:uncharacterized membrane protein YoaK (UPF0700 family)
LFKQSTTTQRITKNLRRQMSESIPVGMLLAFSGGYMDAYTYLFRDKVFANAQTGNIILFGVNLTSGNFEHAVQYLFPILSFMAGVFIAQLMRLRFQHSRKLHWRQLTVLVEIIIMVTVCFLSTSVNLLANSLISFACGVQVQSFRKIHGNSLATTMCIGNLRTATDLLCSFFYTKEKYLLHKSMFYYGAILTFTVGAVAGKYGIGLLGQGAISVSAVLLLIVFAIMFAETQKSGQQAAVYD